MPHALNRWVSITVAPRKTAAKVGSRNDCPEIGSAAPVVPGEDDAGQAGAGGGDGQADPAGAAHPHPGQAREAAVAADEQHLAAVDRVPAARTRSTKQSTRP